MRRPVHEVLDWPLSSVLTHLAFLTREPIAEERIELLIARMLAAYMARHTPENSAPPRLAEFLSHRDVWERDALEQEILADLEAEKMQRGNA